MLVQIRFYKRLFWSKLQLINIKYKWNLFLSHSLQPLPQRTLFFAILTPNAEPKRLCNFSGMILMWIKMGSQWKTCSAVRSKVMTKREQNSQLELALHSHIVTLTVRIRAKLIQLLAQREPKSSSFLLPSHFFQLPTPFEEQMKLNLLLQINTSYIQMINLF